MKTFATPKLIFFAMAVAGILSSPCAFGESTTKRLAVIGVKNGIKSESYRSQWDNKLIAYGLCELLAQEFFDTGRFRPVEDNPEIIREIDRLVGRRWTEKREDYDPGEVDRFAVALRCDAVAYAEITKFEVSVSRGFIGVFSRSRSKVLIELQACLKELGRPVESFTGKGEAYTKSVGVIFRVRNGKIYFDETAVGMAAKQAVENAVAAFEER
jgi:hypothetical protein